MKAQEEKKRRPIPSTHAMLYLPRPCRAPKEGGAHNAQDLEHHDDAKGQANLLEVALE